MISRAVALRADQQEFNGFRDPAAVPVVFALRSVEVFVGNAQFIQKIVCLLMVLPKIPIVRQDQPLFALKLRGDGAEQIGDPVLLEVFLRAEDWRGSIAPKLI